MAVDQDTEENDQTSESRIKLIFRCLIPIILLLGGLVLLALRLAGWSIIFGLPMVVFGMVFLVFTYDEVAREKIGGYPTSLANCAICGDPTPCQPGLSKKSTVCLDCQEKISKKSQEIKTDPLAKPSAPPKHKHS